MPSTYLSHFEKVDGNDRIENIPQFLMPAKGVFFSLSLLWKQLIQISSDTAIWHNWQWHWSAVFSPRGAAEAASAVEKFLTTSLHFPVVKEAGLCFHLISLQIYWWLQNNRFKVWSTIAAASVAYTLGQFMVSNQTYTCMSLNCGST